MAVPEQTPYIEHTGNGATTSFALKFQCESKDHLIVLVDEIEPPIATWSLTGGNVVFTTAPATGQKITLQRNTPFGRTTDYQSYNNSFRPPAVNKDFDWIWWKLQELGVADWILGARIDALKNYVDRKDDELKAYLMEEIRKQGVALDQLDEYYNYLMERLAQIAVDKGWDASFVVDGDENQHDINSKTIRTVESIADIIAINNPQSGKVVYVQGFQGDHFKYNPLSSTINNGHSVFNGWERQVPYLHVSPLQWGADPIGATDSTAAFQAWAAHLNHLSLNSTYPPCGLIPTGYFTVSDMIEFYDLSNCTVYSLGAMIGYVGSKVVDSVLKINNAVNSKIVGSLTLTGWNEDKAQCGLLITASTGSSLQADGIANHIDIIGVTARNLVCGFQIGEDLQDYDKHVAELHFVGCNTMVCRTAVRNYGSQTESSFDGCTLASGFLKETDTSIYHALLDIRGGIVTVNGGSIVNSMLPNTFSNSQGIVVKPAKSTLYSNPYPVVAINAAHVELTTQMLSIEPGGLSTNSSAISNVSIQDCKGWMGMLPSEVLIRIWDPSYVGKLSIGSSNNFYTSLNRTGKNIICDAPNAILDVSPMAFGAQMQQGFGSIIGGILKHPLKLVNYIHSLNATLASGKQAIVFTTSDGSGDLGRQLIYNTTNGNIQFPHAVKSINIKMHIADTGINVAGDIFIEKNGAIVCYANKNTILATLDYTDLNVLSTDVYRVYFSKSGATTLLSGKVSSISIYAET